MYDEMLRHVNFVQSSRLQKQPVEAGIGTYAAALR